MAKAFGWFEKERKKIEKDYRYYLYKLINEVTDKIENLIESKGLSKKELAERLKVSKSTVSRILDGNRNMTLETLVKVAFALGYKPEINFQPISIDEFKEVEFHFEGETDENDIFKAA